MVPSLPIRCLGLQADTCTASVVDDIHTLVVYVVLTLHISENPSKMYTYGTYFLVFQLNVFSV